MQPLQHTGKDCWSSCDNKQGWCPWCGSRGMCCTQKVGWTDTTNGCDGTFGGLKEHECVLNPSKTLYYTIFTNFTLFIRLKWGTLH